MPGSPCLVSGKVGLVSGGGQAEPGAPRPGLLARDSLVTKFVSSEPVYSLVSTQDSRQLSDPKGTFMSNCQELSSPVCPPKELWKFENFV